MLERVSPPEPSDDPLGNRLLVREVDGELLILDTVADQIHRLNPTASLIWSMLDQGARPADIEEELASRFEADPETIRRDVEAALANFRNLSLLRICPD